MAKVVLSTDAIETNIKEAHQAHQSANVVTHPGVLPWVFSVTDFSSGASFFPRAFRCRFFFSASATGSLASFKRILFMKTNTTVGIGAYGHMAENKERKRKKGGREEDPEPQAPQEVSAPKKAKKAKGAPKWVVTFADLMSLLCVFVMLLSMSEVDIEKLKH